MFTLWLTLELILKGAYQEEFTLLSHFNYVIPLLRCPTWNSNSLLSVVLSWLDNFLIYFTTDDLYFLDFVACLIEPRISIVDLFCILCFSQCHWIVGMQWLAYFYHLFSTAPCILEPRLIRNAGLNVCSIYWHYFI